MRISVVIPCFNAAPFLPDSLRSVLGQTLEPYGIILVDDGSTDGSGDLARRLAPRARVLLQQNLGVSAARNAGTAVAVGDAVAFLDADDVWDTGKLEAQAAYLRDNPDVVAVGCGMRLWDGVRHQKEAQVCDSDLRRLTPLEFLAVPRLPAGSALVVRSEVARDTRFPEHVRSSEDLIYVACLRVRGAVGAVDRILVYYRQHAAQQTRAAGMFARGVQARLEWCVANWRAVGASSHAAARRAVLEGAASEVANAYWARDTATFRILRNQLRAIWPGDVPLAAILRRRAAPRLLLLLKDLVDGTQ